MKDKLTSYNGTNLIYDEMGNPLSYRDGMSFTWKNGRQLDTITKSNNTIEFKYNSNGMRTQKDDDNYTTYYYYDSNNNLVGLNIAGSTLFFYYDGDGNVTSFSNNDTMYYYVKNLQGDIVKIIDQSGNVKASYTYDAWGKLLSVKDGAGNAVSSSNPFHIANLNPFRYRGYVYDNETGLYYLQSRYYDPITGRFLNADGVMDANSYMAYYNLFAYCCNNPVVRYDDTGMFWKELISGVIHIGNDIAVSIGIDTAGIGSFFLMMKKDKSGVYHASYDCWQQIAGYNDLYDFFFDLGTSCVNAKFPFSYNGKQYIFWAWKGDYINLGAGAEMGIYYGGEPHWLVDKNLALPMGMWLYYKGKKIITYTSRDYQWWCTGFNPAYQNVNASDLTATFSIRFIDPGMYNKFRGRWGSDSRWTFFTLQGMGIASFTF